MEINNPKKEYTQEELLSKIEHFNFRLKQLKAEGETNSKTIKNMRYRRNLHIKKLVKLLAPEIDYASLMKEIREVH